MLQVGCLLFLSLGSTRAAAGVGNSTDALITFGKPAMNDTSPYPYHDSISSWYQAFLKVAVGDRFL